MRLIDADALKSDHNMGDECNKCKTKWRECQYDYIYSKMDFCTWIDDAPTIDAVEVKHGEWIEKWRFKRDGTPFHKIGDMECSVCHCDMLGRYYSKYCPHCGAKMDGERRE